MNRVEAFIGVTLQPLLDIVLDYGQPATDAVEDEILLELDALTSYAFISY
ncbi:unnamed protein product, partial [marine sediment metagenome]